MIGRSNQISKNLWYLPESRKNYPHHSQLDSSQKTLLTRAMALRVLLADESVTIKKVFQLALQDFAVDVVSVNVGVDVTQVATKIKPDIIFADVLLQKMSGYDVSREIKSNPQLSHIPVVLIWSGFLDLDEGRYKSSGANAHLEKPFDTQRLRKLVQSLVPKTNEQPMSNFLNFPKLPDFAEKAPAPPAMSTPATPYPLPPVHSPQAGSWSMESFDNIEHTHIPPVPDLTPEAEREDFVAIQFPSKRAHPSELPAEVIEKNKPENDGGGQWVQKTLTNFKLPPEKQKEDVPVVKYSVPEEKINPKDFLSNTRTGHPTNLKDEDPDSEFELDLSETKLNSEKAEPAALNLNNPQIETILQNQAKEIIEKVVWQIVPEIATRIIERELQRLLEERKEL